MVELCNFVCVGDCKDRLIRNSIVAGLSSTKAYQQHISKGSSLTLHECIKICQTEDATCRQVQAFRPESIDCTDSTPLHKIAQWPQQTRTTFRGRGGHRGSTFRGRRPNHRGDTWSNCPQRDYRCSPKTTCDHCGSGPHRPDQDCGKIGHFANVCRQSSDYKNNDKTTVNHTETEEQATDYSQSEYTTPYYLTDEQEKASVNCLKTTARVHHIKNKDTDHIRLLWVAQSQGTQILQTDCEVNTGAGCNIIPAHKASQLFGKEWLHYLYQPKVHIEAYGGESVHSLGSCVLHLYTDNKAFPTIFEVTNTTGPIILGRRQAKAMGYVQFPQIQQPHACTALPTTFKKLYMTKASKPKTTPRLQIIPETAPQSTMQKKPNKLRTP